MAQSRIGDAAGADPASFRRSIGGPGTRMDLSLHRYPLRGANVAQRSVDDRYGAVSSGGALGAGVSQQSGSERAGQRDLCADRLELGAQWWPDTFSWLDAGNGISR